MVLLVVTFIGAVANLVAIVGYAVTSTAGVASDHQGLATGLVTMSQQVAIAMVAGVVVAAIVRLPRAAVERI